MPETKWLHLFTSNIREQYIADAIDLLAVPEGSIFQFRYAESHVQEDLRLRWNVKPDGIDRTKVIVHYSLQHAANFHKAAYVPLRTGEVVDAFIEGKTYVVRFKVTGYAPLVNSDPKQLDRSVHDFSDAIRTILCPWYPDYPNEKDKRRSASLGELPKTWLDLAGPEGTKFESVVSHMSAALEPETRLFFRVASVSKQNRNTKVGFADDGYLELTAGRSYLIELAHFQAASRENALLKIETMDGIKLLTPTELHLRSRYDVLPIRIFAPFRDDEVQGEMIFGIREPDRGANVRIPVRIKPSKTHTWVSPPAAILGAVLAVVPAMLGTDASTETKLCLASSGAILLSVGALARRSKGLS